MIYLSGARYLQGFRAGLVGHNVRVNPQQETFQAIGSQRYPIFIPFQVIFTL